MRTLASLSRLGILCIGAAPILGLSAFAHPQAAKPEFKDGQAQIVPAFSDAKEYVHEHLWVETEFDSDKDGKKDRVFVDVTRQKQTETEGLKVPVIYESSPYFAGTGAGDVNWNVHQELGAEPQARTFHPNIAFNTNRTVISNELVRTWVPRGFAVVHSEATGTGQSTGSPTIGGMPERFAPKAVIDWLNGRAKGFTTVDGTVEVSAKWCTGKVGMTGTSYNGTIPIAAATTGVKGLECIIPVSPNTSYYHYYRSNGLVRSPGGYLGEDVDSLYDFINSGNPANRDNSNKLYRDGELAKGQDRRTGDYNEFWAGRDLLKFVGGIKCAVLIAHGFNDWNVVPEHSTRISQAIKGKVPLIQYFHQGGHGGDPPFDLMNKWFTRFLYGVKNDVENGPKAYIVRETNPASPRGPAPSPTPYADYPNPEAKPVTFNLLIDGTMTTDRVAFHQGSMSLTDDSSLDAPTLIQATNSENRLLFASPVLIQPVHLSGLAQIKIRLSSSTPAANLSVYLVQLPWTPGRISTANLITRGWADPQNYKSLTKGGDYHSMAPGVPLKPGEFVNLTFDLEPTDRIIPVGKRIALTIMSSDHDFTLLPKPGTILTVDLDATKITVPVVGGLAVLNKAVK
jgi:X-Pro dipeptidyl-peptidase